ncbi:MbtH family NRPS accessory protein [Massilia sp. PAMC28688]|uniref:MbtH family protein n=1 Tax=Massilia sp. PAMC28688 TaxID=2861283 RepID=UPI001C63428D|nr:MbtH family NRPS accessory protein [Massilia sp. PAMC28688]QYF92620.1 MbtH family NRPS accessory protein [Massilia sp. PAMC28688]
MDNSVFMVVINHEEQYSIWADDSAPPAGWTALGVKGSKQDCLDYIRTHWVDMTPASLRQALAG